jgi:1-deoxy-D-xylulose-5-phosphate synthase
MAAAGIAKPVLNLGLPDTFIDQGDPVALLSSVGLDAKGIAASIRARLSGAGEPRLVVNNG